MSKAKKVKAWVVVYADDGSLRNWGETRYEARAIQSDCRALGLPTLVRRIEYRILPNPGKKRSA